MRFVNLFQFFVVKLKVSLSSYNMVEFFGTTKISVSNKHTINVCISRSGQCPGTSVHSAIHLAVSLFLCTSGSIMRGEVEEL